MQSTETNSPRTSHYRRIKPLFLMVQLLLLALLVSACGQQATLPDSRNAEGDDDLTESSITPIAGGLRLLPENPRYFEYEGLPMVLFGHQGGLSPTPDGRFSANTIIEAARYGNSLFTGLHPAWVRASHRELLETLQDDAHWENMRELARTAHEHDVILHVYFWSYLWDYEGQEFTGSDMVWPDPSSDGGIVVAGWSRRDLHELAIERMVEATWEYPNVVYNFMWEYNTRRNPDRRPNPDAHDDEGEFHRWWVERLKRAGNDLDPTVDHLISISEGRALPGDPEADFTSERSPDFIVDEDGNGFWYSCESGRERLLDYRVPLVFISSDYPFADNDFSDWDDVPFCPRGRSNGGVADYSIEPEDVRNMLIGGFHPAEAWAPAEAETLDYYLQARWYMENLGVLDDTLTGALSDVPAYVPSERPHLLDPEGFTAGRNGSSYAAVYRHPQGLAPAQAEVWIDVNDDGRFSPDPAAGERFEMSTEGGDYRSGVLFTVEGIPDRRYVFRFADRNWNPPVTGGLVPGEAEGISYRHWGD